MAEVCKDRFLPRKNHGVPDVCALIRLLLYSHPLQTKSLPCAGTLEEAWPLHTALQTWLDTVPAPEVAMRLSWNGSVLIARTEPRASRRFSGSVLASIPASLHNKASSSAWHSTSSAETPATACCIAWPLLTRSRSLTFLGASFASFPEQH